MEQLSGWRCVEDGYVGLVDGKNKSFEKGSPPAVDTVSKIPLWFGYLCSYCASHPSNRPEITVLTVLGQIQNETLSQADTCRFQS